MDSLETFVSDLAIKIALKSYPALSADDQDRIRKAVQDLTTTAMDLAAIFFALRNAKAGAAAQPLK